jgi:hypothetical protein
VEENRGVERCPGNESGARTREDAAAGSAASLTWPGETLSTWEQFPTAGPLANCRGSDGSEWPIELHSPGSAAIQQRAEGLAAYRRQRAEERARRARDG